MMMPNNFVIKIGGDLYSNLKVRARDFTKQEEMSFDRGMSGYPLCTIEEEWLKNIYKAGP